MPDIVLTTLNAKYAHASFGLRYLMANLGELRQRALMLEFEISQRSLDVVEAVLAHAPLIVGFGVYIWNAEQALRVVADLKRISPKTIVILGGPEVSHETDKQEIVALADYVITGEADLAFADLCGKLLNGRKPLTKIIPADLPEFVGKASMQAAVALPVVDKSIANAGNSGQLRVATNVPSPYPSPLGTGERGPESHRQALPLAKPDVEIMPANAATPLAPAHSLTSLGSSLALASPTVAAVLPRLTMQLPYDLYDERDVAHRVIYVEASRGCPFKCEFCLSSLDVPVRNVPLETLLPAMERLLARGVRHFKFVDRTFNLNLNFSRAILDFFWQRYEPGLFLHFEMIPDRLPGALREPIRRFPAGALQFEVGIQTFNPDVSQRISRRQDYAKLAENLRFLHEETGVHVHADLIVGLPGEDIDSFGVGFDRLVALSPQEIQVGILKRLRGTPIVRHDGPWGMVYSQHPPYEVLQTAQMDFATLQRMRRFSRFWDLFANSGNFRESTPLLWNADQTSKETPVEAPSPFWRFMAFCDWLYARLGRNHAIGLPLLAESLFRYLIDERGHAAGQIAAALWADYQRGGRSDRPAFLKDFIPEPDRSARKRALDEVAMKRQARHLAK